MEKLGYYNGNYGPLDEMTVPMNDRVCWFGDGVYEATTARDHVPFAMDDHIDRFYNSAGLLKIKLPYTKAEMKALVIDMVQKVDSPNQFVYWQATRGTAERTHEFPKGDVPVNIWIMIKPGGEFDLSKKLKLVTIEDTRFLHCNIKTLNLLPNVMAAQKAAEMGCNEAVFHRGDIVTECAHSNVSIIKDGVFKTHPTDHYILPGITRAHLIRICKDNNIPVDETPFTLNELMNADEVIVSSASKLCKTAYEIDGVPVGGKSPEIIKVLQDAYWKKYLTDTEKKN